MDSISTSRGHSSNEELIEGENCWVGGIGLVCLRFFNRKWRKVSIKKYWFITYVYVGFIHLLFPISIIILCLQFLFVLFMENLMSFFILNYLRFLAFFLYFNFIVDVNIFYSYINQWLKFLLIYIFFLHFNFSFI